MIAYYHRTIPIALMLLCTAFVPLFAHAAADLSISESMTAREYRYGEIPALQLVFGAPDTTASDVHVSGRLVREDGVTLSTFEDRVFVPGLASTTRSYPFRFADWKAGYYYVVITLNYAAGDVTDIRRVTFVLRPYTSPYWVYGGSTAAVVLGIGVLAYGLLRRRMV